jgi:hypothetical protein
MGTAAQESQFRYLHQLGKGPALSLWQIEPATARDALERCPASLRARVFSFTAVLPWDEPGSPTTEAVLDQLPGNLYLGAAMCRLVYYMKPFQFTTFGVTARSESGKWWCAGVWKKFYNTIRGKGTEDEFKDNWDEFNLNDLWPHHPY